MSKRFLLSISVAGETEDEAIQRFRDENIQPEDMDIKEETDTLKSLMEAVDKIEHKGLILVDTDSYKMSTSEALKEHSKLKDMVPELVRPDQPRNRAERRHGRKSEE